MSIPFDLDVQSNTMGWTIEDAIDEIISNALDEETLGHSNRTEIYPDGGKVIIHDFGHGLKLDALSHGNNEEKRNNVKALGKNGSGLKHALMVFSDNDIKVTINTCHYKITTEYRDKDGIAGQKSLYAIIENIERPDIQGTKFVIEGLDECVIEKSLKNFIKYNGVEIKAKTKHGEILFPYNDDRCNSDYGRSSAIYVNGKCIGYYNTLFSYNITNSKKLKDIIKNNEKINDSEIEYELEKILNNCNEVDVFEQIVNEIGSNQTHVESCKDRFVKIAILGLHQFNKKIVVVTREQLPYLKKNLPSNTEIKIIVTNDNVIDKIKKSSRPGSQVMTMETFGKQICNRVPLGDLINRCNSTVVDKQIMIDCIETLHNNYNIKNNGEVEENDYEWNGDVSQIIINEIETRDKLELLARLEELKKQIALYDKYTYGWFLILLQLESLYNKEKNNKGNAISIVFNKIEKRMDGTQNIFVLKKPNRPIPSEIERITNVPVKLEYNDGEKKKAIIEAASIKSFELEIMVSENTPISDCEKIINCSIDVSDPGFLNSCLISLYAKQQLDEDYNFKDNITKEMEFIYGPPGTGKTDKLVNDVVDDWLDSHDREKMLILTPTNKAADVLTLRLTKKYANNPDKMKRIARLGATTNEEIIKNGVYKDRSFDLSKITSPVIITTIARYPYDTVHLNGNVVQYCNIAWDEIAFDESSMIKLAEINIVLHVSKQSKFFVAGDPMQLKPIVNVQEWMGENIYTMIQLESFDSTETVMGHPVHRLLKQYRSIESIGKLFSIFSYSGLLEHERHDDEVREIVLSDNVKICPINLYRFRLDKYESIYKPRRLLNSPYQTYSALFATEFTQFVAKKISSEYKKYSIGIITPYSAQAELIKKAIISTTTPENISILADTVHSFQGDECDMIMVVLNSTIGAKSNSFVNNKNLLNVAISRARNHLIIILPDEEYTHDLHNLNHLVDIIHQEQFIQVRNELKTSVIEKELFNDESFIDNSTFMTGHQRINVYTVPERKYEVRADDKSLDVQIHDLERKT